CEPSAWTAWLDAAAVEQLGDLPQRLALVVLPIHRLVHANDPPLNHEVSFLEHLLFRENGGWLCKTLTSREREHRDDRKGPARCPESNVAHQSTPCCARTHKLTCPARPSELRSPRNEQAGRVRCSGSFGTHSQIN